MALDYPNAVSRLAVLDIVPTYKLYTSVSKEFATAYYHWFFLIQPAPLPETLIGNSADFSLRRIFGDIIPAVISDELYAEYLRCYRDQRRCTRCAKTIEQGRRLIWNTTGRILRPNCNARCL